MPDFNIAREREHGLIQILICNPVHWSQALWRSANYIAYRQERRQSSSGLCGSRSPLFGAGLGQIAGDLNALRGLHRSGVTAL